VTWGNFLAEGLEGVSAQGAMTRSGEGNVKSIKQELENIEKRKCFVNGKVLLFMDIISGGSFLILEKSFFLLRYKVNLSLPCLLSL